MYVCVLAVSENMNKIPEDVNLRVQATSHFIHAKIFIYTTECARERVCVCEYWQCKKRKIIGKTKCHTPHKKPDKINITTQCCFRT